MAEKKNNVASKVRAVIENTVNDAGYRLWDVAYYKEGPEMILEVSIDKENGISINDCSVVTKLIEPIIDELDPIEESYCLQVASAGTVRQLSKEEHLRFACDNRLNTDIGLYVAVDGKKEFNGIIESFDDEGIDLLTDGTVHRFTHKQISKINAEIETEIESDEENKEKEDE